MDGRVRRRLYSDLVNMSRDTGKGEDPASTTEPAERAARREVAEVREMDSDEGPDGEVLEKWRLPGCVENTVNSEASRGFERVETIGRRRRRRRSGNMMIRPIRGFWAGGRSRNIYIPHLTENATARHGPLRGGS